MADANELAELLRQALATIREQRVEMRKTSQLMMQIGELLKTSTEATGRLTEKNLSLVELLERVVEECWHEMSRDLQRDIRAIVALEVAQQEAH